MCEEECNKKIHVFQAFDGDSFFITKYEDCFWVEDKKYGRESKCRI